MRIIHFVNVGFGFADARRVNTHRCAICGTIWDVLASKLRENALKNCRNGSVGLEKGLEQLHCSLGSVILQRLPVVRNIIFDCEV